MTAGSRAGLGLTTRCLGLASDTSISSAPEFSPGEPDRKSIVSSSCLLSPSATVWMAVVHSSLQDAQVRPAALPSVTEHALFTWLITHRSRDITCTDHVALMH